MTTTDTTTHEGVVDDAAPDNSLEGAAAALLERWTDAEKPSESEEGAKKTDNKQPDTKTKDTEETDEEDTDADADQTDEDTDGDNDGDTDGDDAIATDDHKVKVTVDGVEKSVSVKELKRLYGQEASLTRKSQEVAALRKQAEENTAKTGTALTSLIKRAEDRYKPYADIDYLVAQTQLSPEDFAALRQEAKAAYDDYTFLKTELDTHAQTQQTERMTAFREQAKEAVEVLKKDIPTWSEKLYDDIRGFAVKSGLNEADVNMIADPNIIKLLHAAMLYEKGKTVATTKKVAAVKKPLKPSTKVADSNNPDKGAATMRKLSASGSREDAAALFLSRWESMGDD